MPVPRQRLHPRHLVDTARSDRGDVVLGWLTKLIVGMSLVGLVLFDAIAVGSTTVSVSDDGSYAARAASEQWQATKSLQDAYDAAAAAAAEQNPADFVDPKSMRIDPDGTVHLVVSRDVTTLLMHHIGPLKKYTHVVREAEGRGVA